jgi:hypothetical protein
VYDDFTGAAGATGTVTGGVGVQPGSSGDSAGTPGCAASELAFAGADE